MLTWYWDLCVERLKPAENSTLLYWRLSVFVTRQLCSYSWQEHAFRRIWVFIPDCFCPLMAASIPVVKPNWGKIHPGESLKLHCPSFFSAWSDQFIAISWKRNAVVNAWASSDAFHWFYVHLLFPDVNEKVKGKQEQFFICRCESSASCGNFQ